MASAMCRSSAPILDSACGVDESHDGGEFVGHFHQSHRLTIAFRVSGPEITQDVFLVSRPF